MKPMMGAVALSSCALIAACSPKPADTAAPAAAAPAAVAQSCDSYKDGVGGVIKTYCKGKASANVKVGDKSYALTGGDCERTEGSVAIYIGVIAQDGLANPPPMLSLTAFNSGPGPFYNATFKMVLDGKTISVNPNNGQFDGKGAKLSGGKFEGQSRFGHQAVSGTFSCG